MKVKEITAKAKDRAEEACAFIGNHITEIFLSGTALVIGGCLIYLKGYGSGIKAGRTEWDFSNDKGEWAVLMEENGDFRTALPISALKEVMDKHKTIPWDDSMWRPL